MTSMACDTENEIQHCKYDQWSSWMPCSSSCGSGSTIRKRFLTDENQTSKCDPFVMENSKCNTQSCEAEVKEACSYHEWGRWMPCSASCGKGKTIRKRFLIEQNAADSCEGFQMEQNRCTVPCSKPSPEVNSHNHDSQSPAENDCIMSPWSTWTSCKCDRRISKRYRVRRRRIMRIPRKGGKKCGRRRERSRCNCEASSS